MRLALVSMFFGILLCSSVAVSADEPSNGSRAPAPRVILVRHAEKQAGGGADPALSEVGAARAQRLRVNLADAGVTRILVTQWRRTAETAAPLAELLNIQPEVVATTANLDQHIQDVVAAVRKPGAATVLVVGHSNTVPLIIAALGAQTPIVIDESEFGDLFMVWKEAAETRLLRAKY